MLCWITTDNKYQKQLVDVVSQRTVIIRHKYFAYLEFTLKTGEVIKPYTAKWVKQEANKLSDKIVSA